MNLKKPDFWTYDKPNFYAYLLSPISILIQILKIFRFKNKAKLKIKTICVGNIYLGGTGKTSLSLKINEILKTKNIKSCFVKKNYKNQIDEQKILSNKGKLFLSNKRLDALKEAQNENYDVAILDDGLQDRSVIYDNSIVCFNNLNWIGNGMTIPSGPLRENIKNLKKYKNVFLNGNLENLEVLKKKLLQINSELIIHIGKYIASNIDEFSKDNDYLVFSGIGNHKTFIAMIKNYDLNIKKDIEFPDHYQYSIADIDQIIHEADILNCKILTTEKDFLRLEYKDISKINFIKSDLEILDEKKLIKALL
tara:strand:- start:489 stop:1412 length:924 start_codon:yes stop_codon:yes gene_type:complete